MLLAACNHKHTGLYCKYSFTVYGILLFLVIYLQRPMNQKSHTFTENVTSLLQNKVYRVEQFSVFLFSVFWNAVWSV